MNEQRQMTLDVGGDVGLQLVGTFRVGGELPALRELPKGADVRIVVTDEDGEIVATTIGYVSAVTFKEHRDKGAHWTERAHRVKPS